MAVPKYYGKYRATVVDVKDPEHRGRIRVQCPKVLNNAKSSWCEPCVPVASDNDGDFCLPSVGETVWVEFEDGNANKPISTGGWYSTNKSPKSDYSDAPNERIISFKGTKVSMRQGKCTVNTPNSNLTLEGSTAILSVNNSQAKVQIDSGGVSLNTQGSTIRTTSNTIELTSSGSRVLISGGVITLEAQGASFSFNSTTINDLKALIGG